MIGEGVAPLTQGGPGFGADEWMVRPCGGGFAFCDGSCRGCPLGNLTYTASTDQDPKESATEEGGIR